MVEMSFKCPWGNHTGRVESVEASELSGHQAVESSFNVIKNHCLQASNAAHPRFDPLEFTVLCAASVDKQDPKLGPPAFASHSAMGAMLAR